MGEKGRKNKQLQTNDIFRKLKKDTLFRFHELYFSIRIINDSIHLFNNGNHYQINVICGQLRSLLFENSSGLKPLLFEILELVDKKPLIYARETSASKLISINDLSLYFIQSSTKEQKDYIQYTIDQFLNLNAVKFNKIKLPLSKLVTEYSNNYGGSHFSDKVPSYIIQLRNISLNGLNTIEYVISKQTRTLYDYSFEVLRSTIELDFFINLELTQNTSENDISIINYSLPYNNNGFSVNLSSKNEIDINIYDSLGNRLEYLIDAKEHFNKHLLFNLEVSINSDFETITKIYINNKCLKSEVISKPFIFINELHNHELHLNKKPQGEFQDYSFKAGDLFYFNEISHIGKKSEIWVHFKGLKSMKKIRENEYGFKKSRESQISFKNKKI